MYDDWTWNKKNLWSAIGVGAWHDEMTKARMPERAIVQCKESSRRARRGAGVMAKWVEFAGRITSEQSRPGAEILDREATWIKFNRDGIVTG